MSETYSKVEVITGADRDPTHGLRLEGDTLTLFKDRWRHVIDVGTIRHVRVAASMEGQPSIWLEFDHAPPYRLPGHCFGSAEPLKHAFRQRWIAIG